MQDKFTERVRKVMYLAREEAGRLQHDYIGTEHLLLGLIREGEGIAANVLTNLGLDLEVIRQLEVFGVCKEGEGGPYVQQVGIGLDAPLPVNPDGGLLSYAWNGMQHMTLRVIELVRQLRGTAVHQVAGAEVGLAANAGSGASHQELVVLGRL